MKIDSKKRQQIRIIMRQSLRIVWMNFTYLFFSVPQVSSSQRRLVLGNKTYSIDVDDPTVLQPLSPATTNPPSIPSYKTPAAKDPKLDIGPHSTVTPPGPTRCGH